MATASSLVPGAGTEVNNLQAMSGIAASNPGQSTTGLPSPTTAVNPTAATASNPYAAPAATSGGTVPVFSNAPSSGVPGASNNVAWTTGNDSVVGDFQNTYGNGTGTALTQVLQGLGTSTDAAVTATNNAANTAANQQYANIQAQQAAAGITPNSSSAALAAGDFYSNVNTALQSTDANMELNEEGTLINSLTNEGAAHGPDTTGWDTFADVMGDIADVGTFGLSGSWSSGKSSGSGGSSGSSDTGDYSNIPSGDDTSFIDDF